MGLLTLIYCGLLGNSAFAMIGTGLPVGIAMGIMLLLFPALGVFATVREFVFGFQVEKLAKSIEAMGQWPSFDLQFRPSGRATRESATAEFAKQKKLTEAEPHNYLRWFALSLAYDAAADRRRAREAMRKALKLASNQTDSTKS